MECSSEGDRRFSAFYARVRELGSRTIEDMYQSSKWFGHPAGEGSEELHWSHARGREPLNGKAVRELYAKLWDMYIAENPELLPVLRQATGLSDKFGKPGRACQATELWRIRAESLRGPGTP